MNEKEFFRNFFPKILSGEIKQPIVAFEGSGKCFTDRTDLHISKIHQTALIHIINEKPAVIDLARRDFGTETGVLYVYSGMENLGRKDIKTISDRLKDFPLPYIILANSKEYERLRRNNHFQKLKPIFIDNEGNVSEV
ncbi:MAG: hypothetical protein ABIG20_04860 [archaeon]